MAKIEETTIAIMLFVDKENRRVLFAEADKDFVDVLFGWLTLPLGTIARLLGEQTRMGCLDQIYRSVEDLSTDYFQTKACKGMLLAPLNAASSHCCQLKIDIDDTKKGAVYICRDTSCSAYGGHCRFSSVPDAVCKCGKDMQYAGDRPEEKRGNPAPAGGNADSGVFVNGCFKFIITDDLIVAPASTSLMMSLFQRFGVRDPADLEKTVIQLNSQKIISLLGRSLSSKRPLTGIYFGIPIGYDDVDDLFVLSEKLYPDQQNDADQKVNNTKMRVLQTINNSLLYAEVSDDFADIIFGLLSIPLGSIIKTYGQCLSKGCFVNIYKSIVESAKGCVKPECQSLLLAPKAVPFSGCRTTKILRVDELPPKTLEIKACFQCFKIGGFADLGRCSKQTPIYSRRGGRIQYYQNTYCYNSVKSTNLHELNPKSSNGASANGEAYVKGVPMKFLVTDDLHIRSLSIASTLQAVRAAKIRPGELLEKEITLTNLQIMQLLRATLTSRSALSSVLLLPPKKRKLDHLTSGLH
ncbi:unnamed protein product [Urochloa humidicola]